jgi:hypothetical protein
MAELSGEAEVPPVETAAMGMADVRVDETAMTVTWTLAYEGLSGEPTAAHIHGPATPEETAPPVVDLTVDMEEATETTEEVAQDIMQGSAELTRSNSPTSRRVFTTSTSTPSRTRTERSVAR